MRRRLLVIAGLAAATTIAAPAAFAADGTVVRSTGADTNGCIVVPALQLAICIPRL